MNVFSSSFLNTYRSTIRGFTLVELLVVLAIIGMMTFLGVAAYRSIGQAQGVSGAAGLVAGLALETRAEAMSHKLGARLIIDNHFDPAVPNRYLRRFLILSARRETPTSPTTWHQTGTPVSLPEGVYLLEDYSDGLGDMRWDFSGNNVQDGTEGQPAYFIEYDGFGMLVTTNGPGDTRLVFSRGAAQASTPPDFPERFLDGRSGIVLRRTGRVSYFESPDQMPVISP